MHNLFLIVGLVLLIFVAAFFSAAETGMMALNPYRLRHKVKKGNRTAKRIYKLLQRPDRLLGVVLIANTFAMILASSLATMITIHFFGKTGVFIATLALTFIILIFAEMTPKTLAALYPQKITFFVAWPLWILLTLFYPIVYTCNFITNNILRLFCIKVSNLFATYLYHGIPPFNAPLPNIRDPKTTGYKSCSIRLTIAGISLGVY